MCACISRVVCEVSKMSHDGRSSVVRPMQMILALSVYLVRIDRWSSIYKDWSPKRLGLKASASEDDVASAVISEGTCTAASAMVVA